MEREENIKRIKEQLRKEEQEQKKKWGEDKVSIENLRQEGGIISPLKIMNQRYDISGTPQIIIEHVAKKNFNTSYFSVGTPITLFHVNSQEQCRGKIVEAADKKMEISLYLDEYSSWLIGKECGIRPAVDEKTFKYMHAVLDALLRNEDTHLNRHFSYLFGYKKLPSLENSALENVSLGNLNSSQQMALRHCMGLDPISIIHGPPGTGKTTTLVEIVKNLCQNGKKIIASAPSNAAIDHLAKQLHQAGLKILRLGNTEKIEEELTPYTQTAILYEGEARKEIKKLRIQLEECRKLARQYKRNFGNEEKSKRKAYQEEAKELKQQIKATIRYHLLRYLEETQVVLGTPIGLQDSLLKEVTFDAAVLDEAGQCLIPLGLLVAEKAEKFILAGDHHQLPPTVLSTEAAKEGLTTSILEEAINNGIPTQFLATQYRMSPEIANFSSSYFYGNKLVSDAPSLPDSLVYYDTAGAEFNEKREGESWSCTNLQEIEVVLNHRSLWEEKMASKVFISPYAAQVRKATEMMPDIPCSTIDSFQGQEADLVIISLVRSNEQGKIGFLKDHRRMNVALTRAKKKLVVIGDSTTLTKDPFYQAFVTYTEQINAYHSVFELLY